MKFQFTLLAAAGLASAATILDYVPACSWPCFEAAVTEATPCDWPDGGECQCIPANYYAIYDHALFCVIDTCGAAVAINQVLPRAQEFCADVTGTA